MNKRIIQGLSIVGLVILGFILGLIFMSFNENIATTEVKVEVPTGGFMSALFQIEQHEHFENYSFHMYSGYREEPNELRVKFKFNEPVVDGVLKIEFEATTYGEMINIIETFNRELNNVN